MRVLVWSMRKWSDHNVRVAYGDVRMIDYVQVKMCERSSHNVRVNMECASREMCE